MTLASTDVGGPIVQDPPDTVRPPIEWPSPHALHRRCIRLKWNVRNGTSSELHVLVCVDDGAIERI
jgi:hypothetical protein